jgi:hypothetical protein
MKWPVTMVSNLNFFLEYVLQPIFKDSAKIKTGREIKPLKLRPRELMGNFLVSTVAIELTHLQWTISTDPESGDGSIYCMEGKREGEGFNTEHVYIPTSQDRNLTDAVIKAINKKISKGVEYGKNRHLVVFVDNHGTFDHQIIKDTLKEDSTFLSCWVYAKYDPIKWKYIMMTVKSVTDPLAAYEISINDDFKAWNVKVLGRI